MPVEAVQGAMQVPSATILKGDDGKEPGHDVNERDDDEFWQKEATNEADKPTYRTSWLIMSAILSIVANIGDTEYLSNNETLTVLLVHQGIMWAVFLVNSIRHGIHILNDHQGVLPMTGMASFSLVVASYTLLQLLGLDHSLMLNVLLPFWLIILARLIFREKPSRLLLSTLLVCTAGVMLLAWPELLWFWDAQQTTLQWGVPFAVLQACSFGLGILYLEVMKQGMKPLILWGVVVVCGRVLATLASAHGTQWKVSWPRGIWDVMSVSTSGLAAYGSQLCIVTAMLNAAETSARGLTYLSLLSTVPAFAAAFQAHLNHMQLGCGIFICSMSLLLAYFLCVELRNKVEAKSETLASDPAEIPEAPMLVNGGNCPDVEVKNCNRQYRESWREQELVNCSPCK